MKISREVIGLIVLILIFTFVVIWMGSKAGSTTHSSDNPEVNDPSVYNARYTGSKGVLEFTRDLGYTTHIWKHKWNELDSSKASVLLAIDPLTENVPSLTRLTGGLHDDNNNDTDKLTYADAMALDNWLRKGHTAVIISSNLPSSKNLNLTGNDKTFVDNYGIEIYDVNNYKSKQSPADFAPLNATTLSKGVYSIHCKNPVGIKSDSYNVIPLFGNDVNRVAAMAEIGKGRIIFISDSMFVSNINIMRSQNATFIGNILSRYAQPGSTVLFDEYHHGDIAAADGMNVWSALGGPIQIAIIQALLAALLLVGVVGIRFGAPVMMNAGKSRNSAEYVSSLSSLFWKAGASITVLEMIYRNFLRELTTRLGLSSDTQLEHLADIVARRLNMNKMEIRNLIASCEQHIDSGRLTETELLDYVRRMDRIRKEIGIV